MRHPFDLTARVLAERLQGLETSPELRSALRGTDVNWEAVIGQASEQFVLAALAAAVHDIGIGDSLESELRDFLAAIQTANAERNNRLRDQLADVAAALNRIGIEPVLLKGAIRLVDDLYPDPVWRMMRDLDILVPKARVAGAVRALHRMGYDRTRMVEQNAKDVKLRQPGLAQIELHSELFSTARQQRLLRGADMICQSQAARVDGATVRVPSLEHQLVHLIGHSQIGHHGHAYGRIALRDRLEAAALAQRCSESDAWATVFGRFAAAGYRRPLLSFLLALNDGGLCAVPTPCRVDALTALQERRIALQARSTVINRVSLHLGWYAVLLKMQLTEREVGRPKIVHTLRRLVLDREERQRLVRAFFCDVPRPW